MSTDNETVTTERPPPLTPPHSPTISSRSDPPPSPKRPSTPPDPPTPKAKPLTPTKVSPPHSEDDSEPEKPLLALSEPNESPLSVIDMETFQQILDLDDEDSHEFSRGMTWAYFTQAEETFKEMEEASLGKDLPRLSSLGHFLKGSSATLGLFKVQASCEKIQHYGQLRDEEIGKDLTDRDALSKIEKLLTQVQKEYEDAEKWLKGWYDDHPDADPSRES